MFYVELKLVMLIFLLKNKLKDLTITDRPVLTMIKIRIAMNWYTAELQKNI